MFRLNPIQSFIFMLLYHFLKNDLHIFKITLRFNKKELKNLPLIYINNLTLNIAFKINQIII